MTTPKRAKEMMTKRGPALIWGEITHTKGPYSLAEEHWAWLGPTLEKMFKDAFVHGYKHGRETK